MPTDGPDAARHQRIADDHRALKALLARIDEALDQRNKSVAEVGDLLGELGDRLIRHFTLEEEGGYFAEALTHAPRLVAKANELLAQHPRMCTRASELVQLASAESPTETWWRQTRERFLAFQEELLKHERAEDGLLQEAYQRDLGAND